MVLALSVFFKQHVHFSVILFPTSGSQQTSTMTQFMWTIRILGRAFISTCARQVVLFLLLSIIQHPHQSHTLIYCKLIHELSLSSESSFCRQNIFIHMHPHLEGTEQRGSHLAHHCWYWRYQHLAGLVWNPPLSIPKLYFNRTNIYKLSN